MDTEKTFFLGKDSIEIECAELENDDLATMELCVDCIRHLQEIHNLFLVFKFQTEQIWKNYTLMSDGKVFRDQFPADQEEDYIAINAYTTNIISAGKTMIESMKNFTDLKCLTDENRSSYSAMVSKIYDTVFSYKLLIRLRDYAQHGHLPVNSSENIYYFDLINILGKPHFNHNKAVKEQMIQAIVTCADLFKDTPRLSLTKSLAEFVAATFRIYRNFWMFAEYAVLNAKEKIKDIVATYPENVIQMPDDMSKWFIYKVADGNADTIALADDPEKMFVQFKEEAEKISDQYIQAWHELIKDAQLIRFLDKDHIKIVPYDQHI